MTHRSEFPQLRRDPIVDRCTLIAPARAGRPGSFRPPAELPHDEDCPFCEGREPRTPPEITALRPDGSPPNSPGWRVRVIPNRFPAVSENGGDSADDGIYSCGPGRGAHELLIDCPQHEPALTALPVEHIATLLRMCRDRVKALHERFAYAQLFKNYGLAAGASLVHAHTQIIAVDATPSTVRAELAAVARHRRETDRCLFCELIERETEAGSRTIVAGPHVVAFAAYAGRFPYESWILPRKHETRFEAASDTVIAELGATLRRVIAELEIAAGRPAYNLVLHTAPVGCDDFHWHVEILPRLTGVAGFEWGSGTFINPLPPEEAAKRLRGD